MSRVYKPSGGPTLTGAQRLRIEANRQAALKRRAEVIAYRRSLPPPLSTSGFARPTALSMATEKKVIDINQTTANIENTGTSLYLLNGCIAGSQNYNRIGRKTKVTSIHLRGLLRIKDETVGGNLIRCIIVYDKQSNGAAPTYANIMQSQNIAGTTESNVSSHVNLDNRDRFVILRDMHYAFGPSIDGGTAQFAANAAPGAYWINEYFKVNLETIYNAGTAGTIGDIQSGAIYLFFISSQANASGADCIFTTRVRFVDY